jgi:hypothetical protein
MAIFYDIDNTATVLSPDGRVPACAASGPLTMLAGENFNIRHRGAAAAERISALVARCVL